MTVDWVYVFINEPASLFDYLLDQILIDVSVCVFAFCGK